MTSKYLLLGAYALLGIGLLTGTGPAGAPRAQAEAAPQAAPVWEEQDSRAQDDVDPTEDEDTLDDDEDDGSDEEEEILA